MTTESVGSESLPPAEAFAQMHAEHRSFLLRAIRRHLSPNLRTHIDSNDVLQSVWVLMLHRIKQDGERLPNRDALRGYLATMIRNRVVDHARRCEARRRREMTVGEQHQLRQEGQPRPSEQAQARELWDDLMGRCPPQHRQLLTLKRQGLTIDEIASRADMHPGSVRRILYDLARRVAAKK